MFFFQKGESFCQISILFEGILFAFDGGQSKQNAALEETDSPFSKAPFRFSCSCLRAKHLSPTKNSIKQPTVWHCSISSSPMKGANRLMSSIWINYHISQAKYLPKIKRLPFIYILNYPFWGTPSWDITLFDLIRCKEHSQRSHEQLTKTTQKTTQSFDNLFSRTSETTTSPNKSPRNM